ncbi:MAG: glycosyltransferase [Bacteroidales bacterium]|nr:glycosyltransferase [Bacteroidales bacterium]
MNNKIESNPNQVNEMMVSVLMLTYNQENYIAQAIRSVIRQKTNFKFELIIGDDCSTDKTAKICSEFQLTFPDIIKLEVNSLNLGLQQNFIKNYNRCTGKYIAICEGDDYWISKQKLSRQVSVLEVNSQYSMCFHRVLNYFEKDNSKSLSNGGQKRITSILDLATSNYITNVSILFRRGLFGKLPTWFANVSTYDYAIHLINAQYGDIYYSPKVMAVYRIHEKGIWSDSGMEKRWKISLQIRELLMDYFKKNQEVYNRLRNSWMNISISLHQLYVEKQMTKKKEELYGKVLTICPERIKLLESKKETEKTTLKSILRKFLTLTRKSISKLIPLPN